VPGFHHVELWVADLAEARLEWGWLLRNSGSNATARGRGGVVERGGAYLTLTTSPNLSRAATIAARPA
jgi:hypothetical protein